MSIRSEDKKIQVVLDEESLEILMSISPELRNSAIIIALKRFANDTVYKKYFCVDEKCKEEKQASSNDDQEEPEHIIEPLKHSKIKKEIDHRVQQPIVTFDDF